MSVNYYDKSTQKLVQLAGNEEAPTLPISKLPDINISSPQDGELLIYDGTASNWANTSIDETPTKDSIIPISSGGVYSAIKEVEKLVTPKFRIENNRLCVLGVIDQFVVEHNRLYVLTTA